MSYSYKTDSISNIILRGVIFICNIQKIIYHAIELWATLKTPVTHLPDKISKIPSVCFVAFRCGVYVPNLSSLASKLWEEIEVTDRQRDDTSLSLYQAKFKL